MLPDNEDTIEFTVAADTENGEVVIWHENNEDGAQAFSPDEAREAADLFESLTPEFDPGESIALKQVAQTLREKATEVENSG